MQNEPSTGDMEINYRIQLANVKFRENKNVLLNKRVWMLTRINLLHAFVRSTLCYSSQNWTLTEEQMGKVDSCYFRCLRSMVRGGYRCKPDSHAYVLTNNDLLKFCNTIPVSEFVARLQVKYTSHIIVRADLRLSNSQLCFAKINVINGKIIRITSGRHSYIYSFTSVNQNK